MPPLENTPGDQELNNSPANENEQPVDNTPAPDANTDTPPADPPPSDPPQDNTDTGNTPAPVNPPVDTPPEQTPEELALEQRTEARKKQLSDLGFDAHPDSAGISHIPDTDFSVDEDFVKTGDEDAWQHFIEQVEQFKAEGDVEPESPPFVPFDYTGMVRLSDINGDAIDVKKANKLVKASGVYDKYKGDLLDEIKSGKFSPQYAEMMRKIITADHLGSAYSGGL